MATRVEIISKELIKPNSPTPHHLKYHRLSYLDQIHLPYYVSRVFFYTMPNIDNHFQISHQLKQSVSEVLTKFYPLAGRIHEAYLLVDCNDSGALFVEAQVHAFLTQAIQRTTMEEEELYHYLPMKPFAIWDATDRDVVLGIQISFFECGSIAIGVCLSHNVADLMSLVTFVKAWAATCRGEKELVLQPMFDLGSHYFPPRHIPPFARENDENPAVVNEKLVTKRFLFDKKKLAELKALASSATNAKVKDPTRVEGVSAFISKILMEINHAKSNPKSMFAFSHSVNLRSRLTMSQNDQSCAFGNFSALSLSASFMCKKDKKFHNLVSDVRTVTRKFNNYQEEDVVNNVVSANDRPKILAVINNPNTLYCHFTSGCKLPLLDVDYGRGKPLSVCAPALPVKNRVILMDAKGGEGIQALVTFAEEDMKMLSDELLSLETIDLSN